MASKQASKRPKKQRADSAKRNTSVRGKEAANVEGGPVYPSIPEADFLAYVTELATLCGWLVYHTYDSRRSQPGFPDLVLCKDGRVIFAELKSQKGPIRKAQQEWLDNLQMNNSVEVYLWRPADIDGIHRLLLDKKTVIT